MATAFPLAAISLSLLAGGAALLGWFSGATALLSRGEGRARSVGAVMLALGAVVLLGLLTAHHRYTLGNRGDSWVHLALTLESAEGGFFPDDAYFPGLPTAPQYSLFHVVSGAVVSWAGMDAATVWNVAAGLGFVLRLGAVYLLGSLLLGSWWLGLVAAAFSLLVPVGESADPWSLARPYALALSAMLLSQWILLRGLRKEKRVLAHCGVAGVALGVTVALHLFVGIMALGSVLLVVAAWSVARRTWPPHRLLIGAGMACVMALVIGSPWIVHAARMYARNSTGSHGVTYGSFGVSLAGLGFLKVARPGAVVRLLGGPGLALLVGVGGVLTWKKGWVERETGAAFLALGFAASLLLLFTPLFGLVEVLFGRSMAGRLPALMRPAVLAVPGLVAAGGASEWAARRLRRVPPVAVRAVGLATAVLLVFWAGKPFASKIMYRVRTYETAQHDHAFFGDHPQIRSFVAGGVLLTDRWTSYRARYYFDCTLVSVPPNMGSPYADYAARSRLVDAVLRGELEAEEVRKLRERYPFSHVLVNKRLESSVAMEPEERDDLVVPDEERLASVPGLRTVYDSEDFLLLEVK